VSFLYNVTLQTNQLSGDKWSFDATSTGGAGSLAVAGAASLCLQCNAYGASVGVAGVGSIAFGSKWQSAATRHYRCRFYLDPNTLTMAGADTFTVCRVASAFGGAIVADVYLQHDGASYELDGAVYDDAAAATGFTATDITDAPHWVEVYVLRAETNVSADGACTWWIDGVEIDAATGLDNYDLFLGMTETRLGAVAGVDAGTSGTFYVDELEANDDGKPIGPCGPCPRLVGVGECGDSSAEWDQILVPGAGSAYESHSLLNLFGLGGGILRDYRGFGYAPSHFITQRGPFQDGESILGMRYDTRTLQIVIEEEVAGRISYWDRRYEIMDLLRANRSFGVTVRPLIYRKWLPGGKLERNVDLATTAGSSTVTSHDGRFVHWGVVAGQPFLITSGLDTGAYTVSQVINDYTVVLDQNMVATATGVHYEYLRGQGRRDLYCLLEEGPAFDEGVEAQPVPAGYREALRFVAHDPMWYGAEQTETWDIAGPLGDLVFDGLGAWLGTSWGSGRWLFAPTNVGQTTALVYWGTAIAKPVVTVVGPAENPAVENTTLGVSVEMDYTLALGETVTIDMLALTVINNFGDNLLPYTTGDLATFGLSPAPQAPDRQNEVFVTFSSGLAGTSAAYLAWRNRYVGI
jgi:hypothetical protein